MIQEYKELLLKDLRSRLPYGVILQCCEIVGERLCSIDDNGLINNDYDIEEVKPCLFPLSSMTEEQKKELNDTLIELELKALNNEISRIEVVNFEIDYYLENHFDYKGFIPMGVAVDATNLNVY